MELNQRIIVVTGASSGIGRALAREFHTLGYKIILVARRKERLEDLKKELEDRRSDSAEFIVCDLTVRSEVKILAEKLKELNIYGLVNNAGVGSLGPFYKQNLESELSQIELNVISPLILEHAVIPIMIENKNGFIINVSSIMAFQAVPYVSTYAATKAFELRHSNAMNIELAEHGIKILTLCPGPTDTEFFGVAKVPGGIKSFKRASPETVARICINDLNKGKIVSIPTIKAKILVFILRVLPFWLYALIIKLRLKSILSDIPNK